MELLPTHSSQPYTQQTKTSSKSKWLLQLEEELDYKLLVRLRDGRIYVGVLRSFDQFGNLLLNPVYQRLTAYHPELRRVCYADIYLGTFIVRGDNMMLFGRMKDENEVNSINEEATEPVIKPPVPISPILPSECQMIERPLQEVSKLILENEKQQLSAAKKDPTSRNFMWSSVEPMMEDPYF